MKVRYIHLSESDKSRLIKLKRMTTSSRVMERCHALLLSSKGYQISQLSDIFSVKKDTITSWFNRWEMEKFEGLNDAPKSGRPSLFTQEDKKKL